MTTRALIYLAISIALSACALTPSSSNDDDELGAGDGSPAAAGDPSKLVVNRAGTATPVTQWQFGDVGQGSFATLVTTVTNIGGTATSPLRITITGANADQFTLGQGTDCGGKILAPGGQCQLILVFAPGGALGPRAGQVNIFGAATLAQIGMRGNFVASYTSIAVDVMTLDFGPVDLGDVAYHNVTLTNTGTVNVSLSPPLIGAAFQIAGYDCGPFLAPGASCVITVEFSPTRLGDAGAVLSILTAANSPSVFLTGVGQRVVHVTWTGNGQVTSLPGGLMCDGNSCTGHFAGLVSLTATPAAGSTFLGWSPVCGVNPTCTLPANNATPEITISAAFSP